MSELEIRLGISSVASACPSTTGAPTSTSRVRIRPAASGPTFTISATTSAESDVTNRPETSDWRHWSKATTPPPARASAMPTTTPAISNFLSPSGMFVSFLLYDNQRSNVPVPSRIGK